MSADSNKKGGRGKNKDKRQVECFHCHKKGHVRSKCWAKGGGNEGGGPQRKKKEDASQAEEKKDEPEAWAAIEEMGGQADEMSSSIVTGHTPAQAAQSTPAGTCELYDSGATHHMSPFRDRFKSYHKIPPRVITAADKRVFYTVGLRDLEIEVPNGTCPTLILLKDVLHAPDMGLTIVSISRIAKARYSVTFKDNICQIQDKADKVVGMIPATHNGLYKVERVCAAIVLEERIDLKMLHRHLAHIAPDAIRKMVRDRVIEGIDLVDDGSVFICEACKQAKATRKEIRKERVTPLADAFGGEVHTDLWGPALTPSLGGRQYYVSFTNNYSQYTELTVLHSKDQTLDTYKAFANWAET